VTKFIEFGKRLFKDEEGATAIEYGLLAALIAVGIIAIVGSLGQNIAGAFDEVDDQITDQNTGTRFAVD